ncbi:MAG: hypothetical protein WCG27_07440 [Pseudomonadota bacterium]
MNRVIFILIGLLLITACSHMVSENPPTQSNYYNKGNRQLASLGKSYLGERQQIMKFLTNPSHWLVTQDSILKDVPRFRDDPNFNQEVDRYFKGYLNGGGHLSKISVGITLTGVEMDFAQLENGLIEVLFIYSDKETSKLLVRLEGWRNRLADY